MRGESDTIGFSLIGGGVHENTHVAELKAIPQTCGVGYKISRNIWSVTAMKKVMVNPTFALSASDILRVRSP